MTEHQESVLRSRLINNICFYVMRRRLKQQQAYRDELHDKSIDELYEEHIKITGIDWKEKCSL